MARLSTRYVAALFLPLGLAPTAIAGQSPTSMVHFFVSDGWGKELGEGTHVEIFRENGVTTPFNLDYPEERAIELPLGLYYVVADYPAFLSAVQSFVVGPEDMAVGVPLAPAPIESRPGLRFVGSVEGNVGEAFQEDRSKLWIQAIGIYQEVRATAIVEANGNFVIPDLAPGRYLLSLHGPSGVLSSRFVDVGALVNRFSFEAPDPEASDTR